MRRAHPGDWPPEEVRRPRDTSGYDPCNPLAHRHITPTPFPPPARFPPMPSPSVPRTPHVQPTSSVVQSLDGVYLRHAIDEYRAFSLAGDPGSVDAFTAGCLARWTARWGANRLHSLGPDRSRRYFGGLGRRGYPPPAITREKSLIAAFCRWAEKRYSGGDVAASQGGAITAWNAAEQRRL